MTIQAKRLGRKHATIATMLVAMAACAAPAQVRVSDEVLQERVRSALLSASDVPGSQLTVDVQDGVVVLTGSTACAECGGMSTPGGIGTVEQSIGAIVRAVPGVESVRFVTRRD